MVYLYIFLVWLSGLTKTYYAKYTSQIMKKDSDAYLIYAMRMLIGIPIGLGVIIAGNCIPALAITGSLNFICLLSGIVNAAFVIVWFMAVRYCKIVTVSIVLLLGSVIPISTELFIFKTSSFSVLKLIGIILLIVAMLLMSDEKKNEKKKIGWRGALFLIGSGLLQGLMELSQQLYKHYTDTTAYPTGIFSFYTFVYAFIVLSIMFFIIKKEEINDSKKSFEASFPKSDKSKVFVLPYEDTFGASVKRLLSVFVYIFIMAVCTFVNTYFMTKSTTVGGMPSDILYATIKGGNLFATAILGLAFHEKITWKTVAGILVAIIALLFINVFAARFSL